MPAPLFPALRLIAACLLTGLVLLAGATVAHGGLIRDADIENALRRLAQPVITAAGLNPRQIRILVIDDNRLNAFITDNRHIFIHSGLILRMKRAEELQAVIAHEAAHIANGHIARRIGNFRNARGVAGLGLLLSAAVGASTGNAQAAVGLALGTNSAARRIFLGHTRAEEAAADQAALRYMARRNIDTGAMIDVLEIFRGQEVLSPARQDPYVLSHPLTPDRIRAVRGFAAAYGTGAKDNPQADYWFRRAQGKLGAWLRNPATTLRRIRPDDRSELAVMRRAVAHHRLPDPQKAIAAIDRLVALAPDDPYWHELRGQILLESRRFSAAAKAYGRAVALAPDAPLILAGHGRALLALNTRAGNRQALPVLERARARDPFDPRMLRDLALAYARGGANGMASVATAERYALLGRFATAGIHATRAAGLLPQGSPGWNRAQDVLRTAQIAKKDKG